MLHNEARKLILEGYDKGISVLSLIVPVSSASADMCFNFKNCYNRIYKCTFKIFLGFVLINAPESSVPVWGG